MRRFLSLFATVPALFAIAAGAAAAQDAARRPPGGGFALPIACTVGRDCWVMNYPDVQPGPGVRDPFCGPRSYDGHKGTDIAVRDIAAMRSGVDVLAAADGVVKAVRDGMADRIFSAADAAALKDRECGNGVLIEHGGGWETQYCHMRQGSVAARPGTRVAQGSRLGLVGLSGQTAFPHVHLSVRQGGQHLDPNRGRPLDAGCDRMREGVPLWAQTLPYEPGALYAAGFATGAMTAERIKEDASSPAILPANAQAIVLWGAIFGVRVGDRLTLRIDAPDGRRLVDRTQRIARDQAWRMAFSGAKRKAAAWPSGIWRGTVDFRRDGKDGFVRTLRIETTVR